MEVPESQLRELLLKLAGATADQPERRRTAVRWFNRLYYQVRGWNEGFIRFLRRYPGFDDSQDPKAYQDFLNELGDYRAGLDDRYSSVKHDLCGDLKVLSARYTKDFDWLYDEEEPLFWEIRGHIDQSYATEGMVVSMAGAITDLIWQFSDDPSEHIANHSAIVQAIEQYEDESRAAVAGLETAASSVGIALLSIDEYEAALRRRGSADPRLLVLGEVTVSQDEIYITNTSGIVNVKGNLSNVIQNVGDSALAPDQASEFRALLDELSTALEPVMSADPTGAELVADSAAMIAKEVSKQEPNPGFLGATAEGLKAAASAVAGIAPEVLSVASKIAKWVVALV